MVDLGGTSSASGSIGSSIVGAGGGGFLCGNPVVGGIGGGLLCGNMLPLSSGDTGVASVSCNVGLLGGAGGDRMLGGRMIGGAGFTMSSGARDSLVDVPLGAGTGMKLDEDDIPLGGVCVDGLLGALESVLAPLGESVVSVCIVCVD